MCVSVWWKHDWRLGGRMEITATTKTNSKLFPLKKMQKPCPASSPHPDKTTYLCSERSPASATHTRTPQQDQASDSNPSPPKHRRNCTHLDVLIQHFTSLFWRFFFCFWFVCFCWTERVKSHWLMGALWMCEMVNDGESGLVYTGRRALNAVCYCVCVCVGVLECVCAHQLYKMVCVQGCACVRGTSVSGYTHY